MAEDKISVKLEIKDPKVKSQFENNLRSVSGFNIQGPTSKDRVDLLIFELGDEIESLSNFLRTKLKADITSTGNKILIDSENLSSGELKRLVTKFLYRRNLMNEYWVALKGNVAKINKFRRSEKHEKRKGKGSPPSTVRHGW